MLPLKVVDRVLIVRAAAGDVPSTEALLAEIWPAAYRTAVALCGGDTATAQDAVQNACVACFSQLPKLREPDKFVAWFMRILTRAVWKERRRNARWRSSSEPDSALSCEDVENWSFLNMCVLELSKPLREALILSTIVGYTSAETAEILGVPAGTVRFRVHQARAVLSGLLYGEARAGSKRSPVRLGAGASHA